MVYGNNYPQLINFLQEELAVSPSSIAIALRYSENNLAPLHMVLWKYGLVSLQQLDRIFDWLESSKSSFHRC
jgi:hypothetical protein